MDEGAHYHRCDFQVHTPRDRQWKGAEAVTADERRLYAGRFVAFCREKSLHAVAITDHHDLAFVPYIRAAAADERDNSGKPIPKEQQLVVFPGIELTLSTPCQALLILDADFPDDLLPLVLTALAIDPSLPTDSKTTQTERLAHIVSLEDVHKELDKHAYLRHRYIVLPNVSEGAAGHSLLRKGFANHYVAMPCVGGYLDGAVTQHGTGNQRIVNGLEAAWGNKRLALFQTSDNRRDDFQDLGKHSTWVKWATPKAEALRQACLAQESRVSQADPVLPAVTITAINISNSRFLGPVQLELNPQYTAFIGGRGTGKSTILEYLRWALCDQPPLPSEDDELPNYQVRRQTLIERTLAALEATVEIRFLLNGIPHVVRRNSKTHEIVLKIGGSEFAPCSEAEVRSLLPIDAYSQKQLSNVGVRLDELTRFVEAPIRRDLEGIAQRFRNLAGEIRQRHAAIQRKRSLEQALAKDELSLQSLNEQAETIRKSLSGISPEDRATITERARYDEAQQILDQWSAEIDRTRNAATDFRRTISGLPTKAPDNLPQLPESATLAQVEQEVRRLFGDVSESLRAIEQLLSNAGTSDSAYHKALQAWRTAAEAFDARYKIAKERSTAHESRLKELTALEKRLNEIRAAITKRRGEIASLGAPEERYTELRQQWLSLHAERTVLLAKQCESLTDLSRGEIRATLRQGAGLGPATDVLKKASGLRANKVEALLDILSSADEPVAKWDELLTELELVATYNPKEETGDPSLSAPLLAQCGIGTTDLVKMAARFGHEQWLDLSLVPIEDPPQFEYRAREADYIPFSEASAGQQATALLSTLLNQEGPPLIIDQPEDDLDNQVVLQVVERLWDAKKKRQLIFASHNANLVVNGDAELVVSCDYRTAGDHSGGKIKCQGAIDVEEIRTEITRVMEGGELAFKLRRDKYGF
jgi:type III restriction enzyme